MGLRTERRSGSILIIALWTLCLLTTFVVYSGLIVRQKLVLVDRLNSRDSLHLIGESGVNAAILELRRKDDLDSYYALNEGWSNNPWAFENTTVGMGTFTVSYTYQESDGNFLRYGLMDETAKININLAEAKVLTRLISHVAGLNEQRALDLAYCIIDWRDKDSFFQHPQYGAEDGDYKGLNSPYESKDSDYEVIDELLLVKGVNEEIYAKIKDFITVYGEGKVNINTASGSVFLALGLNPGLVEKILDFRKGDDGASGTFDDNVFSSTSNIVSSMTVDDLLNAAEVEELTNFISGNVFVTKSSDFMVKCLARLNTKHDLLEITAVTDWQGYIRYWREQYN